MKRLENKLKITEKLILCASERILKVISKKMCDWKCSNLPWTIWENLFRKRWEMWLSSSSVPIFAPAPPYNLTVPSQQNLHTFQDKNYHIWMVCFVNFKTVVLICIRKLVDFVTDRAIMSKELHKHLNSEWLPWISNKPYLAYFIFSETFEPWLQVQFSTRNGNVISRNYCISVTRTNFCVACLALAMQHLLKHCRKIENSAYSCNFLSANSNSAPCSRVTIFPARWQHKNV